MHLRAALQLALVVAVDVETSKKRAVVCTPVSL